MIEIGFHKNNLPGYCGSIQQPHSIVLQTSPLVLKNHIDDISRRIEQQRQTIRFPHPPCQHLTYRQHRKSSIVFRDTYSQTTNNMISAYLVHRALSPRCLGTVKILPHLQQLEPTAPCRHDKSCMWLHTATLKLSKSRSRSGNPAHRQFSVRLSLRLAS